MNLSEASAYRIEASELDRFVTGSVNLSAPTEADAIQIGLVVSARTHFTGLTVNIREREHIAIARDDHQDLAVMIRRKVDRPHRRSSEVLDPVFTRPIVALGLVAVGDSIWEIDDREVGVASPERLMTFIDKISQYVLKYQLDVARH